MKRRIPLFFLLALLLTVTVSAANTYRLDELGMSVDIPGEYVVVTRNMAPDDPALAVFDMDAAQVDQLLEERNIYLDVMNDDPNFEFNLTMLPNNVKNMNQFDETSMESMQETLKEQYENFGLKVKAIDHFIQDRATFFRTECVAETNDATIQLWMLYTVYNNQAITMTMQYTGDAMPEQYEKLMQDMLESTRFDDDGTTPASAEDAETEEEEEEAEPGLPTLPGVAIEPETQVSASAGAEASVQADSSAQTDATAKPAATSAKKKGIRMLPIILGLVAVSAILGIIGRSRRKRAAQAAYAVPVEASGSPSAPGTPAEPSAKRVCGACGAGLSPDDQICPYCGTKVE